MNETCLAPRGILPNDRPHMFRVMGSVDIPRTGLVFAVNLQHYSGKPWAASAQSLLDMRLSRTIAVGGRGRIELLVDVLNVLNDTAEEGIATDNRYSPNFGQPTVFLDPRRVMLSVRLNLGR